MSLRTWPGERGRAVLAAVILGGALVIGPHALGATRSTGVPTVGLASWYGAAHHGRATASGERYDMRDFTAAHRTLPLDTQLRVTNLANGRKVLVRVSDRGPFTGRRIIDLSRAAAAQLGLVRKGIGRVKVEIVRSDVARS
jgi:rare lipoprotein A